MRFAQTGWSRPFAALRYPLSRYPKMTGFTEANNAPKGNSRKARKSFANSHKKPLPRRAGLAGIATDKGLRKLVALGNINGWQPPARSGYHVDGLTPRHVTRLVPPERSDLAASYQQAQHARLAYYAKAMGQAAGPRLMIVAWGHFPVLCDIPAMTAAINAHVRRHDTYHKLVSNSRTTTLCVARSTAQKVIDFVFCGVRIYGERRTNTPYTAELTTTAGDT